MKKLLIISFVTCFSFLSLADTPMTVTKKNRGLFGYKQVTEVYGEGMHTLSCFDPGRTSCRSNGLIVLNETLSITEDVFLTIDGSVENLVKNNQRISGKFVFDGKCFITYSYNPDKDELVYTIYSLSQAETLNLI